MNGRNFDVLLLRPQEIKDVIDMKQAIDLVEQGYPRPRVFRSSTRRDDVCIRERTLEFPAFPAGWSRKSVLAFPA